MPLVTAPQPQQPQTQQHYDLSKEIMTIKAQLLAVVNRLDHVEKNHDDEEMMK
jgi:hypothetical protein